MFSLSTPTPPLSLPPSLTPSSLSRSLSRGNRSFVVLKNSHHTPREAGVVSEVIKFYLGQDTAHALTPTPPGGPGWRRFGAPKTHGTGALLFLKGREDERAPRLENNSTPKAFGCVEASSHHRRRRDAPTHTGRPQPRVAHGPSAATGARGGRRGRHCRVCGRARDCLLKRVNSQKSEQSSRRPFTLFCLPALPSAPVPHSPRDPRPASAHAPQAQSGVAGAAEGETSRRRKEREE